MVYLGNNNYMSYQKKVLFYTDNYLKEMALPPVHMGRFLEGLFGRMKTSNSAQGATPGLMLRVHL